MYLSNTKFNTPIKTLVFFRKVISQGREKSRLSGKELIFEESLQDSLNLKITHLLIG